MFWVRTRTGTEYVCDGFSRVPYQHGDLILTNVRRLVYAPGARAPVASAFTRKGGPAKRVRLHKDSLEAWTDEFVIDTTGRQFPERT